MSETLEWKVKVADAETSAAFDPAIGESRGLLVCAHGAGGNMSDRSTLALTKQLRSRGLDVVRFNFLYRERGSGRPDTMPRLEQCYEAVVERAREELSPARLFIGGRSMGGRAASMMASRGFACDGLMLFAYPLHPPGQPEKLRDAHLASIKVPVICFNGTRDAFSTRELMERALEKTDGNWTMHWIDGADHSFHVPKSSGRTDSAVLEEVGDTVESWLA